MTRRELRPEINPSSNKPEIAIYIDGINCGYEQSYLAADQLAQEIIAKRESQTAAYLAPRSQPRKAKVSKKTKKPACPCNICNDRSLGEGIHYCRADREYIACSSGQIVARDASYIFALDALNRYRYEQLSHGHGLDGEQAGAVLSALDAVPTTN